MKQFFASKEVNGILASILFLVLGLMAITAVLALWFRKRLQ